MALSDAQKAKILKLGQLAKYKQLEDQQLAGKEDALTVVTQGSTATLTAALGKYYRFTTNVGTLAITLPAVSDATKVQGVMFSFTTGSSPAVTISSADSKTIKYFSDYAIEASKRYELNCIFNGTEWVIAYGTVG